MLVAMVFPAVITLDYKRPTVVIVSQCLLNYYGANLLINKINTCMYMSANPLYVAKSSPDKSTISLKIIIYSFLKNL